jgi:hypothetical protein
MEELLANALDFWRGLDLALQLGICVVVYLTAHVGILLRAPIHAR